MGKMVIMHKQEDHNSSSGFISIFSVMIIMGILTLLTVGFTNVVRQGQNRSLNDQLNSQAYYAAETGINDAISMIYDGTMPATGVSDCNAGPFSAAPYNVDIDSSLSVSYTCVLVDMTPTEYVDDSVQEPGNGQPTITKISPSTGGPFSTFQFFWDSINAGDGLVSTTLSGGNAQFLDETTWGSNVGVLRVDLIPISNNLTRANLAANTYTAFLYPSDQGTPNNGFTINGNGIQHQGAVNITNCDGSTNAEYRCAAQISLPSSSQEFYLRMYAYYNPVRVTAQAIRGGGPVELKDGQAVIDATGRANDVYRRVRVTVPLDGEASYNIGSNDIFGLMTADSVCKRLRGVPGGSSVESPGVPDPSCDIN